MSLIQEALKRQQQDAEKTAEPDTNIQQTSSPTPVVPTTTEKNNQGFVQPNLAQQTIADAKNTHNVNTPPEPPRKSINLVNRSPVVIPEHAKEPKKTNSKNKSEGSRWKKLIIALIILFIIIITAGYMVFFAMKKLASDTSPQIVRTSKSTEEVENLITTKQVTVESKPATIENKHLEIPIIPKIAKNKKQKTHIKEEKHIPVKWPPIEITAAMAKGNGGQAIINGKFIAIGDKIDGVTLMRINGNTVELSYKKEKKLVKVGNAIQ